MVWPPWISVAFGWKAKVKDALDAAQNLQHDPFEGKHQWHGEAYPLLASVLRP